MNPRSRQAVAPDRRRAGRRRAPRRCPGTAAGAGRPRSAVAVRIGSTTTTCPGASDSQCSKACGADADGIGAPDDDAGGVCRRSRVEPALGRPVDVVEGDVTGQVADGVGVDLGRAEPVEEAHREGVGEQRERAGVVGVEDRLRPLGGVDLAEPRGDRRRWPRPRRPARRSPAPLGPLRRSGVSSTSRDRATRRCSRSSTCGRARRG